MARLKYEVWLVLRLQNTYSAAQPVSCLMFRWQWIQIRTYKEVTVDCFKILPLDLKVWKSNMPNVKHNNLTASSVEAVKIFQYPSTQPIHTGCSIYWILLKQTKTIWVSVWNEVLTEMLLKIQVIWDMAPHHLINSYWCCKGLQCLQLQSLRNLDCLTPNMKALWSLRRPVTIYKPIQHNILKGFNLNLDFSLPSHSTRKSSEPI